MRFLPLVPLILVMTLGCSHQPVEVKAPDWLSYSVAKKQVKFDLIATENANNNGFNYNGYYGGNITLNVPVGWQVEISLTNRDATSTHDVILTESFENVKIPEYLTGESASIKRAYITPLFANETEHLNFIAKAGQYWLFCGVKGHGIEGMQIKFESHKNTQIPSVTINE